MSATTANHQPTNNIIFQQPNQPIIVQQLGNNQLSYVTDNQLGQNTVQYLTPGNVLSGGFTVANDATNALNAGGNILVPNGQGGYTVIPTSALQIQSQPQVIGTLIQPQATTIQCGMMSTEQMVLNGTPTLEMVTDPTSGCMYLTSQPMYYGLETIVQNTVMSSQQFVSTAMPGVLSQNSSFSATTTQVFQASKIEPMVEVPTGYVVLNNNQVNPVTSTTQAIMPAPSIQTHVSQPQLQNQNQMQTHQHQQQQITQQYNNMPHVINQPAKPTIKTTPMNVSKNQPQLVNKVMPNTTTGTMQFKTEPKYNYQAPITTEKLAPVKNYIKPKIVAKPVKQKIVQPPTSNTVTIISNQQVSMPMKPQEMPYIPPAVTAANQMPLQMIQNAVNVKKVISVPENKPNKVTKTKVKTYSGPNPPALCFPQKELPILPEVPVFSNVSSAVTITTVTTTATTVATTTTSQTASIQLPTAPYVPLSSVYSNIPTNIVNPIQQQTNNNTISLNSRPTNRVLPMQASMQISPQTPPPLKIWTNEDLNNEVISPPPNEEKDNTMIPNVEIKEIEVKNDVEDMISFEESFNKCVDEMSAGGASPMTTNDEPETPEIKSKISEILENLEHGDDCKNVENTDIQVDDMDTEPTEENNAQMMIDSIFEECRQKDDLEPIVRCSPEHENNNDSDTSSKNNGNLDNSSEVHQEILNKIRSFSTKTEGSDKSQKPIKSSSPKLLYEIQSQDGFTYKSTSIVEIWDKLFEAVQLARKAHGLMPLPEGQLEEMAGIQMLGLKTNALKFLLEQLPGVERCNQYTPQYHQKKLEIAAIPLPTSDYEDIKESQYGAARCEPYSSRSEYDMFSWLASRHRRQPMPVVSQNFDETILPRRGSGSNLPMAMRYRTLKETSKESVGVYRSHIHGRGLFCNRDIEAGEMVIEYAGELIRSTLTDQRERYYNSRGIGCYMFKIDENFVVDATMKGNAARFINHACEPNCYSKVVDILGHKHIIIFALRRIVQGEELTYDYKFPIEDVKIPCSCGSKKCRKHLN